MENSSYAVFSVLKNFNYFIKTKNTNKSINRDNLFKPVWRGCFDNCRDSRLIIQCQRIYNELENHYYTYDDMIIALAYMYLFSENVKLSDLKTSNVVSICKKFTRSQLDIDKKFILNVNKYIKFNKLEDFFKLNDDCKSVIYELIMDKTISPIFYCYFVNKYLTNLFENDIFNTEYKRFNKIISIISTILFN